VTSLCKEISPSELPALRCAEAASEMTPIASFSPMMFRSPIARMRDSHMESAATPEATFRNSFESTIMSAHDAQEELATLL
jgi:hypothetical protein